MKLYELSAQYRELQTMDAEFVEDTLEGIEGEIEVKAENLLAVVSNINSDVDAISNEIKRLQARKKTLTTRQDWLREYLRDNMEAAGIDKITCPLFTITLRKPTKIVDVLEPDLLPEDFQKVTIAPDKVAIKKALESGIEIPGCKLVDGRRGLMIK